MPHNLPVRATSFVGREVEIARLRQLLPETRLLTLTGAGGVGKSRLALEVATVLRDAFPDGVWLVELAPLVDPELVPSELADSLGLDHISDRPVLDLLVEYLQNKAPLLLIDNCEHVISVCARVVETLIQRCPQVRILATSRELLDIPGEVAWRVPSLTLPDTAVPPATLAASSDPMAYLRQFEASRLFLERAEAALPGFHVDGDGTTRIATICSRVDGIPLAVELAAARVKVLSVAQIAPRLDDVFHLLTAGRRTAVPRQQTLEATIDWSYNLLTPSERCLFYRVSLFAGGWSLEAAEAICSAGDIAPTHVLNLLARLIDKSLVLAEVHDGVTHYRLHEPICQYAAARLRVSGEERELRDRHRSYYAGLAAAVDAGLRGPDPAHWARTLEREYDNVRIALDWADRAPETYLAFVNHLTYFWYMSDRVAEGRDRIERAITRNASPTVARARALTGAGWLAHFAFDAESAQDHAQAGLELSQALGDRSSVAWALHLLGRIRYFARDPTGTHAFAAQSEALARAAHDPWVEAWAVHLHGLGCYIAGDFEGAQTYMERSLAMRQAQHDAVSVELITNLLAMVLHRRGDLTQSARRYRAVIESTRRFGRSRILVGLYATLSALAATISRPEDAALLAAASVRRTATVGVPPVIIAQEMLEEGCAFARSALGPEAFHAAWDRGTALDEADAITVALRVTRAAEGAPVQATTLEAPLAHQSRPDSIAPSDEPVAGLSARPPDLLSDREREVLALLALGHTSRSIADQLTISVPTVDRHITHIYGKIGVRKRTDATRYALAHGLIPEGGRASSAKLPSRTNHHI